jgi:ABC-type microcin C transport system duplicated ATPase subunit YejF
MTHDDRLDPTTHDDRLDPTTHDDRADPTTSYGQRDITTFDERGDPPAGGAAPLVAVRGLKVHFPIIRGVLFDRVVGHVRAVDGVDLTVA